MIWKSLRKITQQLFLIFCMLKKKKYFQNIFRNITHPWRTNNLINDYEQGKRRIALSCSKKKLFALLHKKTSKHKGDFYCLNCLNFFRTEKKLKSHEKVCKNKDFCEIVLPSEKIIYWNLVSIWKQVKCRTLFTLALNV